MVQKRTHQRFSFLGLGFALAVWFAGPTPAQTQEAAQPGAAAAQTPAAAKPAATAAAKSAKRYFVEFRSRSALSYGHTFLVYGKLNAAGQVGQVTKEQVAGLHPATESSVPWMIGHVVPVVSETGASDGDTEDQYITARYRVLLTEAEYARVVAFINEHKRNSPLWHAVLYNCNAWVGDVAKFMGLKTPDSTLLYPEDYIGGIASLNGGKLQDTTPRTNRAAKPARTTPAAQAPAAKPTAGGAQVPPSAQTASASNAAAVPAAQER